jgi:hypothetical protein
MTYEINVRRVFVSYLPQDRKYFQKIVRWQQEGKLGNNVIISSWDDADIRDEEGRILRKLIEDRIRECLFTIVICGENNLDHPWLDWEGQFTHHWGVQRFIMRIPYTEGELPDDFRGIPQLAYNPNSIEKLIRDFSQPAY